VDDILSFLTDLRITNAGYNFLSIQVAWIISDRRNARREKCVTLPGRAVQSRPFVSV